MVRAAIGEAQAEAWYAHFLATQPARGMGSLSFRRTAFRVPLDSNVTRRGFCNLVLCAKETLMTLQNARPLQSSKCSFVNRSRRYSRPL